MLGLSSKREITRTSIRVRTAMAAQTREQGRYLGGRPPYGYRLADAGPHPNKAHAAWGRRAHRLEPDPETAHVVRWMFAQRLAGHSVARITRALNDAGVPCPSAADPGRNPHRAARRGRWARWRRSWATRGTPAVRYGTGSGPTPTWPTRPTSPWGTSRCSGGTCPTGGSSPPGPRIRRWSARPTSSPPRTSAPPAARATAAWPRRAAPVPAGRAAGLRDLRAADGVGLVQRQGRLPVPPRPHHRHHARPGPGGERLHPRGRDPAAPARAAPAADRRCPAQAQAPHPPRDRRRHAGQRRGRDRVPARAGITLTYDPAAGTLRAGAAEAAQTITRKQANPGAQAARIQEGGRARNAGRPALAKARARVTIRACPKTGGHGDLTVSEGGLEPPCP